MSSNLELVFPFTKLELEKCLMLLGIDSKSASADVVLSGACLIRDFCSLGVDSRDALCRVFEDSPVHRSELGGDAVLKPLLTLGYIQKGLVRGRRDYFFCTDIGAEAFKLSGFKR